MPDFSPPRVNWPRTLLATAGATTVIATAGFGIWLAVTVNDTATPLLPREIPTATHPPHQNALPHSGGPVPLDDPTPPPPALPSPPPAIPEILINLGALAGGTLGSHPLPSPQSPALPEIHPPTLKPPPLPRTKISIPADPISPPTPRPAKPRSTKPTPARKFPDPCATFHDIRRTYCYEVLESITGKRARQ
ncbi:hypothetical protein Aph01nite_49490 [Acrocarpospora phusangensis]|uniref:Uncharacterized protein n=1 Tax=Acrocarpospora phusangensis TaxID=1070424 RepID=A0A919QCF2_9ACTN|nr:hypothetical protein Aph01nite_49490 [Acrocarpospora phusangensis]